MKKFVPQIIAEKRRWHHQPTEEEKARGFKGWYSRGYLPHFDALGTWQFVTYRLGDSVPSELRHEWAAMLKLEDAREKFRQIERFLDRGLGACHLRDARIARLVQGNLWFHDNRSYRLLAWVLMPNHVHLLAEMWKPLGVVLKQWKSYTAGEANKILGTVGSTFWQAGYFDRYIRDEEHYRRVVRYIENNPVKGGLVRAPEDWTWSSARYRGPYASDELPRIPKFESERGQPCPRELQPPP
ncbi:MAG: REP-associated tyrosine transposase [Verrucomicrobiota bacterium]